MMGMHGKQRQGRLEPDNLSSYVKDSNRAKRKIANGLRKLSYPFFFKG
jgi:hypothetical protein